jgi:hypothetical protein
MAKLDLLIKALDTAHWELGEAFKGLQDVDVWQRPHPKLWSIGEISSHIAFWEDNGLTGGKSDSPFLQQYARYYSSELPDPLVIDMGAEALYREVQRVHGVCKASLLELDPAEEEKNPFREGWSWRQTVEYQAFHVAYHTGQIYTVRHLFGHETEDN